MDFDAALKQAWIDHGEQPEQVAAQVPALACDLTRPDQVAALAALVTHVCGAHLGDAARGLELLSLLPATDDGASVALARQQAVLQAFAGERAPLLALEPGQGIAAWALLADLYTGRGQLDEAAATFAHALDGARGGLPEGSPAPRALAVAGNNLACALEELARRSPEQTRAMLMAAEAAQLHWRQAGGWLEVERAAYRLARSRLAAGDPGGARSAARECLDLCQVNQASAFERFFAHAALAMALCALGERQAFETERERARLALAEVDESERRWCEDDWAALADAEVTKEV